MNGDIRLGSKEDIPDSLGYLTLESIDIQPLNSHQKAKDSISDDGKHRARNRRKESSTCLKCLRGTMSCYNVILLLVGLGGLGAGVWLMLKDFNAQEVAALTDVDLFAIASYLLIAGGGVVSLLAFCGCCGTMKEDRCVLGFYATTLTLMFLMLVGGAAVALLARGSLEHKLKEKLKRKIAENYGVEVRTNSENRLITDAWDSIQREFECCGVTGNVTGKYSWQIYKTDTRWYSEKKEKVPYVPESCCKGRDIALCTGAKQFDGPPALSVSDSIFNRKENPNLSSDGCYEKLLPKIGSHSLIIGLICASIPLILIVGIVVSCCLCFKVEKDPDDDDSYVYGPESV